MADDEIGHADTVAFREEPENQVAPPFVSESP